MKYIRKSQPKRDPKKKYDKSDFSDFFVHAPAKEQKKVIKSAVEGANKQQKDMSNKAKSLRTRSAK